MGLLRLVLCALHEVGHGLHRRAIPIDYEFVALPELVGGVVAQSLRTFGHFTVLLRVLRRYFLLAVHFLLRSRSVAPVKEQVAAEWLDVLLLLRRLVTQQILQLFFVSSQQLLPVVAQRLPLSAVPPNLVYLGLHPIELHKLLYYKRFIQEIEAENMISQT